jgi:hypothetical protein
VSSIRGGIEEMKMVYHRPKLTIHGSIKEITKGNRKKPGSSDGQANASQGSGILGDED